MALFGGSRPSFLAALQRDQMNPAYPPDPGQMQLQVSPMEAQQAPQQAAPSPKRHWGDKVSEFGEFIMATQGNQAGIEATQMRDMAARAKAAAQLAEQQYQRRRADENTDWQARQQWERANPKPINNDTYADLQLYRQELGPEAGKQFLQGKVDPIVTIPLPGGRTYIGPRSGMPGASPASTAPPEFLTDDDFGLSPTAAPTNQGRGDEATPTISQGEAAKVLQSMGGNRTLFNNWMRQHRVTVR